MENVRIVSREGNESSLTTKVSILVGHDDVKKIRSNIVDEIKKKAVVKGFRKGKAPASIIERLYSANISEMLNERVISHALGSENLSFDDFFVFGMRVGELVEGDDGFMFPMYLDRKDDENLNVVKDVVKDGGVSFYKVVPDDKDVDNELDVMRDRMARHVPVEGNRVGDDSIVKVEYTDPDKEGKGFSIMMEKGKMNWLIAEEEKAKFINKKVGDEVSVVVKQKEEDKAVDKEVKVKIIDVYKVELPELNDEFAQEYGFDNLNDLKENIRERLKNDAYYFEIKYNIIMLLETIWRRMNKMNTIAAIKPPYLVMEEAIRIANKIYGDNLWNVFYSIGVIDVLKGIDKDEKDETIPLLCMFFYFYLIYITLKAILIESGDEEKIKLIESNENMMLFLTGYFSYILSTMSSISEKGDKYNKLIEDIANFAIKTMVDKGYASIDMEVSIAGLLSDIGERIKDDNIDFYKKIYEKVKSYLDENRKEDS